MTCEICCEVCTHCETCHRAARAAALVDPTLWDRIKALIWRHA
jgi:hypothetical protein